VSRWASRSSTLFLSEDSSNGRDYNTARCISEICSIGTEKQVGLVLIGEGDEQQRHEEQMKIFLK